MMLKQYLYEIMVKNMQIPSILIGLFNNPSIHLLIIIIFHNIFQNFSVIYAIFSNCIYFRSDGIKISHFFGNPTNFLISKINFWIMKTIEIIKEIKFGKLTKQTISSIKNNSLFIIILLGNSEMQLKLKQQKGIMDINTMFLKKLQRVSLLNGKDEFFFCVWGV